MASLIPNHVAVLLLSFAIAGYLVHCFRHYLRDRRHSEKWAEFMDRAKEDNKRDKDAFVHMFGQARVLPHWINLALVLGWCWGLSRLPSLLQPSLLYLFVGFVLTRQVAKDARPTDYVRLGFTGRFWFNQFYTLTWPLHVLKDTPRKSD